MKKVTFIEQFKKARKTSTPIIVAQTPDPAQTVFNISQAVNGAPVLIHDVVNGVRAIGPLAPGSKQGEFVLTDAGQQALNAIAGDMEPKMLTNPVDVLSAARNLPPKSILFMANAQNFIWKPSGQVPEAAVTQAIWNLRDEFKANFRTLILLCPSLRLPPELEQDVFVLDEPFPDRERLEQIVTDAYDGAMANGATKLSRPSKELLDRAIDAMSGLSAFPAEQECFMSMDENDGLDVDALTERKCKVIERNGGLSVHRGRETYKDVKGLDRLTAFIQRYMGGPLSPGVIVFMDEVDKMFAGLGNEQDSVTKEMFGRILTWCEEKVYSEVTKREELQVHIILLIGHGGTGKSLIAKATGNEFKKPTIICDISSTKNSLVGQSQANLNRNLKVIDAAAAGKSKLLIATCNKMAALPPEFQRRIDLGIFFVDLPDGTAREQLWKLYTKYYGVEDKNRPVDEGWTGAEIRNCCMLAYQCGYTLKEAAENIVPIAISRAEDIQALRKSADGRYLDAAKAGKYKAPALPTMEIGAAKRAIGMKN